MNIIKKRNFYSFKYQKKKEYFMNMTDHKYNSCTVSFIKFKQTNKVGYQYQRKWIAGKPGEMGKCLLVIISLVGNTSHKIVFTLN